MPWLQLTGMTEFSTLSYSLELRKHILTSITIGNVLHLRAYQLITSDLSLDQNHLHHQSDRRALIA